MSLILGRPSPCYTFQVRGRASRFIPKITEFTRTGSDLQLTFTTYPDEDALIKYTIEQSTDLGGWLPLSGHEDIVSFGAPVIRTLSGLGIPSSNGARYFRVKR